MDATTTPRRRLRLLVPRLFDSLTGEVLRDQAITISRVSGLIVDVRSFAGIADPGAILSDGAEVVDMRLHNLTILPGFIDTHVHRESFRSLMDALGLILSVSIPLSVCPEIVVGPSDPGKHSRENDTRNGSCA